MAPQVPAGLLGRLSADRARARSAQAGPGRRVGGRDQRQRRGLRVVHPGAQLTLFEAAGGWTTACILLCWLKHLDLDGKLANAEPGILRYRVLHVAVRLVRGGRREILKIAATCPWAAAVITAWNRIRSLLHPPDRPNHPVDQERSAGARGTPGHLARRPGRRHAPASKTAPEALITLFSQTPQQCERSRLDSGRRRRRKTGEISVRIRRVGVIPLEGLS